MNLAQSDPYYIPHASDTGRLYLVRSRGPLSAGTCVRMVSTDSEYENLVVEAVVARQTKRDGTIIMRRIPVQVGVENRDLVIRRLRKPRGNVNA